MGRYRIVHRGRWYFAEVKGWFGWKPAYMNGEDPAWSLSLEGALKELDEVLKNKAAVVVWEGCR